MSLRRCAPLFALTLLALLSLPGRASAEAMVRACNEAEEPVSLAMRVFGFAWERESLAPGQCRHLRISGFNLIFDAATLWHGAKLRLEPLNPQGRPAAGRGFCEWKIDFGARDWQHHAIRLEERGVTCIYDPAPAPAAENGTT